MDKKGVATSTVAVIVILAVLVSAGITYIAIQPSAEEEEQPTPTKEKVNVALVTDTTGRGGMGFVDLAIRGARLAQSDGYVDDYTVIVSQKASDYVPNLRGAAMTGKYDLIVGIGYMLSDAVKTVSNQYPDQNFALIDAYPSYEEDDPGKQNTIGLLFHAEQACALTGALSSMVAAHYDYPYVGIALGIEGPVLYDFELGYKWGTNWAISWMENNQPEALQGDDIDNTPMKNRVLWTYTGSFTDPAKGSEAAGTQYAQGAATCMNAGGVIGLGIFSKTVEYHNTNNIPKSEPPFGIGVDADQDWIEPGYILASALKKVDVATKKAIKWVYNDNFRSKVQEYNGTWVGSMDDNVVGISDMSTLNDYMEMGLEAGEINAEDMFDIRENVEAMREAQPDWFWTGVEELKQRILNNEVEVPQASTAAQMENYREIYG